MDTVCVRSYDAPPIDKGEILRYAGVRGDAPELCGLLDECISEAYDKLSYKVCYVELPVSINDDTVTVGTLSIRSETMKKALSGCSCCLLFAATAGIGLDRLISRYSVLSPTKALLLSALGAERIESLCDAFCREMAELKAKTGNGMRPRFSAGYGDIPLELQKEIFKTLDCQRRIGLTLGESLLMSPSKSVTAFVGITGGTSPR